MANKTFINVAKFKYLRVILRNKTEHMKKLSKLNSENACYHSVQNALSSHLLSTNIKIKYTEL